MVSRNLMVLDVLRFRDAATKARELQAEILELKIERQEAGISQISTSI